MGLAHLVGLGGKRGRFGFFSIMKPSLDDVPVEHDFFIGASLADFVCGKLSFHSTISFLIEASFGHCPESLSKKVIYARLCRPNCFDNGTSKCGWIKSSGKNLCCCFFTRHLSYNWE
ncbi:hypothetical protein NC652_035540 [Populus alba x Populus x berolinensis]|nr:hypothetical protein NC652_035540 [Populus alba x Populus x berolinensis]